MAVTININGLTLCHKGSNGISVATVPDVCKTPSPGGPVPIPYPDIAFDDWGSLVYVGGFASAGAAIEEYQLERVEVRRLHHAVVPMVDVEVE